MATAPAKKASREDWHPADIKAALEKKGWTLRALGEHHGIRGNTLSHTFDRSYPINERRIADAIGVPVQEIWPSRYYPDGRPRQRGIRRTRLAIQSTPAHCQHNGKTQQVA
ncbi:helix-turn-helix domain-containing protein [Pseudazoarcus pumilus]|uniref:Transcriptional regulator n=1 Tax=Pseudazoarcus pumilus TaxID=2067960 RepID=A0A2I6S9J3_9RHOO|nr:helix-turn-helix transcriptional regulator [Pseudazoarcus pumilus]AUN95907.1 transcriptional regulator [Pseudazoarcus pumilus]